MRTLIVTVLLLAILPQATACDVCGCSIGGNYFGILPQFHRHIIGLHWSSESSLTSLSADAMRQTLVEHFKKNLTDEEFLRDTRFAQ